MGRPPEVFVRPVTMTEGQRLGNAWRSAGHPVRLRAAHSCTGGVRHMLAALDLATGKMIYREDPWTES